MTWPIARAVLTVLFLTAAAASAIADDWVDYATVSMTNPTTPKLTPSRLCYTDGTDLACDGAAGLFTTSGTLSLTGVTASTGSFGGLTVTGGTSLANVSATNLQIGESTLTCSTGISGTIRYSTASNTLQVCNSVGWVSLASGTTGGGNASVGGSTTQIQFNDNGTLTGTANLTFISSTGIISASGVSATNVSLSLGGYSYVTITALAGSGGNFIVSGTSSVSTSNAGSIKFATGGTQRMVIDSSGNVGIGTASPSSTLSVYGIIQSLTGGFIFPDGTTQTTAASGSGGVPSGAVQMFAMQSCPSGWLTANNSAISRSTYASLFAAIGTTYGSGNGSTTFNLPDLRGQFIRAYDDGRGVDTGRVFGSSQADANASHNHGVNDPGHSHSINDPGHAHSLPMYTSNNEAGGYGIGITGAFQNRVYVSSGPSAGSYGAGTGISINGAGTGISTQSSGGSESRPKNVALYPCIKY